MFVFYFWWVIGVDYRNKIVYEGKGRLCVCEIDKINLEVSFFVFMVLRYKENCLGFFEFFILIVKVCNWYF